MKLDQTPFFASFTVSQSGLTVTNWSISDKKNGFDVAYYFELPEQLFTYIYGTDRVSE